MTPLRSNTDPSEVNAEQGQVIVDGPDAVAVTLVSDAAEITAERLKRAADQARRQGVRRS